MTTRPTGGRAPEGRGAASSSDIARPPPLPARVVGVSPGPHEPGSSLAPSRLLRRLRRAGMAAIYTLIPVVLLAAMGLGVLYFRLRHGPITFDFLVPPIERGINAELEDSQVDIAGAELRLGDRGELEFRLRDLTVLQANGDPLLASPLAAVSISSAALMRGRVVPARIELIDPEIVLNYSDEAGFTVEQVSAPPALAPGEVPRPVEAKRPAAQTPAINPAKLLSDASRRARRRIDAASYLTEFTLTNAKVVLNYQGNRSSWQVPEASVDFDHSRRRSVISGRANVASANGPWAFSFVTDETEKDDKIVVKATVRDLVPSTISAAAPPLALLDMFHLPVAGNATVEISTEGAVERSELALEIGQGTISHPAVDNAVTVTGALFKLAFDGAERRWELQPSPVKWVGGSVMLSGVMRDVATPNAPPTWHFKVDGRNGLFEAPEFNVKPVAVDTLTAEGALTPRKGTVDISSLKFSGGGGQATARASTLAGPNGQSAFAEVNISAMPLETIKALWPRAVAPGARVWVGENVSAATFKGGTVRFVSGEYLTREATDTGGKKERLSATFEVGESTFYPILGLPPVTAPRALVQLTNNALEINVPEAAAVLPGNRKVPLKAGRVYSPDIIGPRPDGEITFGTASPLGPFLEFVETLPMRAVREASPLPKAGEGKVDGQFTIRLPLVAKLNLDDVTVEGKAKISDGRFGKVGGHYDVQGFTLNLELTDKALDAKGDLLVNGVAAKVLAQRVFASAPEEQPPIKVTASLDEADRTQLGLDINDLIRGVVPVEVSLQKSGRPEPVIKLKANLTSGELVLEQIGWRKAAGRQAVLEADLGSGKQYKTELQNIKIVGDDIAAEGWVGISADNKVREFHFPQFSPNLVSRMEVQGRLGSDNVWDIKARGTTFDGRDIFKSFFSLDSERRAKPSKGAIGTDLDAEIDTVLGGNDSSLKSLKLKLSSRNDKLTALDLKGSMSDGGAPVAAKLDTSGGGRRLLVESTDAGRALKLVDFYNNMQGGHLNIEVNLDGRGPAEKTGILWVKDFKVLGDPIVTEVVSSADQGRPAISSGNTQVTREVFVFDKMKAPFSIGYGQFVLDDAYVKGPLMGAYIRGKIDVKAKRVNVGGTYVPLQGLNGALGNIPLLGQILSGAQGEGIFGITFAVQGATSNPQVIVNPLSLVTPGILREIFQMTAANPKVQVREDRAPARPVQERVRNSAAPATGSGTAAGKGAGDVRVQPGVTVDGWSTSMTPN